MPTSRASSFRGRTGRSSSRAKPSIASAVRSSRCRASAASASCRSLTRRKRSLARATKRVGTMRPNRSIHRRAVAVSESLGGACGGAATRSAGLDAATGPEDVVRQRAVARLATRLATRLAAAIPTTAASPIESAHRTPPDRSTRSRKPDSPQPQSRCNRFVRKCRHLPPLPGRQRSRRSLRPSRSRDSRSQRRRLSESMDRSRTCVASASPIGKPCQARCSCPSSMAWPCKSANSLWFSADSRASLRPRERSRSARHWMAGDRSVRPCWNHGRERACSPFPTAVPWSLAAIRERGAATRKPAMTARRWIRL